MADRFTNKAQPMVLTDRLKRVAEEQTVGGHFEGESKRERKVGNEREVVVDIFKRGHDPQNIAKSGTYFMRVSLRSMVDPRIISRFEIDIERYSSESELVQQALIGGGAVAEADIENRGATWDPDHVAKQAAEAMKELLAEINKQE